MARENSGSKLERERDALFGGGDIKDDHQEKDKKESKDKKDKR